MTEVSQAGLERSSVSIYVTYAQRAAMRAAIEKKKSTYKTYGSLVMAAFRGDVGVLKPKGSSKGTISVVLFITKEDEDKLHEMAQEAGQSISALVRNKLFGEAFHTPVAKYGRQVGYIYFTPEEEMVRAAGEKLGMKGSIHQLSKFFAMAKAAEVLNEDQDNYSFTDNTSDTVD